LEQAKIKLVYFLNITIKVNKFRQKYEFFVTHFHSIFLIQLINKNGSWYNFKNKYHVNQSHLHNYHIN